MTKCIACDFESEDQDQCPVCKTSREVVLCATCKRRIPPDASICNACKSYREAGRRWLFQTGAFLAPLVTSIALISGVVALYTALDRESHTQFKIIPADTDSEKIKLKAWNGGLKPSWLLRYRLVFENPQVDPLPLSLRLGEDCAMNLIKAGDVVTICLKTGELNLGNKTLGLLRGHKVTLEIDIQESNDPGMFGCRSYHTRRDTIDEKVIDDFLKAGSP